jgi:hypothetical protein
MLCTPAPTTGTVKAHAESVPSASAAQKATAVPSNAMLMSAKAANPRPAIRARPPTGPAAVLRIRTGTMVKATDAAFPALSETTTLCAPALAAGMMKGQDTRLPAASAVHEVTRVLSKVTLRESDA